MSGATHLCTVCWTPWRLWPDGTWQALDAPGPCCDNATSMTLVTARPERAEEEKP